MTDRCVATAIVGVAAGTMVGEMETRSVQVFGRSADRILRAACSSRNGKMTNVPGDKDLEPGRRCAGTKTIVENGRGCGGCQAENCQRYLNPDRPAFHRIPARIEYPFPSNTLFQRFK